MKPKDHPLWNHYVNFLTAKNVAAAAINSTGEKGGISWNTFLAGAEAQKLEEKLTSKRMEPAFITLKESGLTDEK